MKVKEKQSETKAVGFAPEPEPIEEKQVSYNSESGKVTLILTNGDRLTLKEPKAKQLLLFQSAFSQSPEEMQSDAIATVRLAYHCVCQYERSGAQIETPSFDEFFDELEIDDIEGVGKGLEPFRDVLERLKSKASV